MHVQPSSGTRCLLFGRTLRLLPYFICANSQGSGETAQMRRLASAFTYVKSTKFHELLHLVNSHNFSFFQIPLAIVATSFERAVQRPKHGRESKTGNTDINMAYVLFWSYFFSLISLVCLFWTDIIPGFGMAEGITDFAKV